VCFSGGSSFKQMKSVARGRFRGGTDNFFNLSRLLTCGIFSSFFW
jgi:hypothetical protein